MAIQALGGRWGLWSCRGQVLVGQLGCQSLSANQVAEGPTQHLGSLTWGRSFHPCLLPVRTKSCGAPQVHKSLARLSMLLPASYADRCGAGLDTHPEVKRPQAVYPVKKDQYITVLFLQKLKMSSRICTGCELALGSLMPAARHGQPIGAHRTWLVQAWRSRLALLALHSFSARDASLPLLSTLTPVAFLSSGSRETI